MDLADSTGGARRRMRFPLRREGKDPIDELNLNGLRAIAGVVVGAQPLEQGFFRAARGAARGPRDQCCGKASALQKGFVLCVAILGGNVCGLAQEAAASKGGSEQQW